jgi:hypothetical protein
MYNRNFHQNPDRPWQYYMDSGSKELQQIMLWNKDDSTVAPSISSDGRSRSTTISEKYYPADNAVHDLVRAPEKTLTKSTSNDSMDVDESDDDDRSFEVDSFYHAPEGVNITPFAISHTRNNFKHSVRLSSIYNGAGPTTKFKHESDHRVTLDNLSPLRFQYDHGIKFEDMNSTPHNSPIRGSSGPSAFIRW